MYELEGALGEPHVLAQAGPCAPLRYGLALLPFTREWLREVVCAEHSYHRTAPAVRSLLARCSQTGPLAHVQASFFPGGGGQGARMWRDGMVVWERDALELTGPPRDWPINAALARLGLDLPGEDDLFDAVGLGRHRDTEDWLS